MGDQQLIAQLMEQHGITGIVVSGAPDSSEHTNHYGWTVTLHRPDYDDLVGYFYTPYSWGHVKPEASFILNTWMSEVSHTASFEEFCDEYLFDPEEDRSKELYQKCQQLELDLQDFLGAEFDQFLYPSQHIE